MLETLIPSAARIKLLKALMLDYAKPLYLRELASVTGLPTATVQLEVEKLTKAGYLIKERRGNQTYFHINERCPILPDLKMMFIKTVSLGDSLRKVLMPEKDSIHTAFIFGSFATGGVTPESDVDIFIIGDITLRKVVSLLNSVDIRREINPVVVPSDEFRERVQAKDHFFTSVLDAPKIFLIGDENELAELAGIRGSDKAADV